MTAKNRLLEALSKPLLEKLAPALKQVPMNLGDHLHEPGKTITTLFPARLRAVDQPYHE